MHGYLALPDLFWRNLRGCRNGRDVPNWRVVQIAEQTDMGAAELAISGRLDIDLSADFVRGCARRTA